MQRGHLTQAGQGCCPIASSLQPQTLPCAHCAAARAGGGNMLRVYSSGIDLDSRLITPLQFSCRVGACGYLCACLSHQLLCTHIQEGVETGSIIICRDSHNEEGGFTSLGHFSAQLPCVQIMQVIMHSVVHLILHMLCFSANSFMGGHLGRSLCAAPVCAGLVVCPTA